jgi:hypothetical protein
VGFEREDLRKHVFRSCFWGVIVDMLLLELGLIVL